MYKVGDKFVVEIGEVYETTAELVSQVGEKSCDPPDILYRIKGFDNLVFDDEKLERLERYGYEKQIDYDEITVGDEIEYIFADDKFKGVVVQVVECGDGGYKVICQNGCGQIIYKDGNYKIKKTGRHFSEISEIIEKMKEVEL